MERRQLKRLFVSAAAGSAFMFSTGILVAEHMIEFEPDRPQVSPACMQNWGYHQTCWKRFGPVQPCDTCDINSMEQGLLQTSPFQIYTPQMTHGAEAQFHTQPQPISVFPDGMDTSPSGSLMNPPMSSQPSMSPQPVPTIPDSLPAPPLMTPPAPDTFAPPMGLPPLPGTMQQSRYGSPSTVPGGNFTRQSGERYGVARQQVPGTPVGLPAHNAQGFLDSPPGMMMQQASTPAPHGFTAGPDGLVLPVHGYQSPQSGMNHVPGSQPYSGGHPGNLNQATPFAGPAPQPLVAQDLHGNSVYRGASHSRYAPTAAQAAMTNGNQMPAPLTSQPVSGPFNNGQAAFSQTRYGGQPATQQRSQPAAPMILPAIKAEPLRRTP